MLFRICNEIPNINEIKAIINLDVVYIIGIYIII